jgi:branched-chain amino acid transport system substrate-binding protein
VAVALLLVGCRHLSGRSAKVSAERNDRIRFGAFMSLTGATGQYGISAMDGMQMAVEEINGRGGVQGKRVELIVQDTLSDVEETRVVVRRLINDYHVHALLGEVVSSRSLAAAEIAQEARVPMLTPSSTSPGVTARGDYIFRSTYTDPFQGAAIAQFAARSLGAKRAAMLVDSDEEYAAKLAQFIREDFVRRGGEVVLEKEYEEGDSYFTEQLVAIKEAEPDVIFLPGYYREAGLIAREAKHIGVNVPIVGGDGWDSRQLYEIGEQALLGSFFSSHYSADDPDPFVRKFVEDYLRLYGHIPDAFAATAYDATRIMIDAFERTGGATDRALVRDTLAQTRNFPGVTGTITFNANRDAIKTIVIIKIEEGGRYAVQERLTPESLVVSTPTPSPTPQKKRRRRARR